MAPANQKITQKVFKAICARLAEGVSLRQVAREIGVSPSTILQYKNHNTERYEQYTRAREIGYELLAEDIVDISDDGVGDTYIDEETGKTCVDHEHIQRSKLRVDTRKWMLAKMLPKVYGDRKTVDVEGNINVKHDLADRLERAQQRIKDGK